MVPLSEQHALSVGIFTYREGVHFGLYVDPEALPDAGELPTALRESVRALKRATLPASRVARTVDMRSRTAISADPPRSSKPHVGA